STLNIAILNISKRDFQIKFIDVVYSRVKTSQNLIFSILINLNALYIIFNYIFLIRATNKVRKLLE
ncbi:uncharacterized protein B0T23DRAFT_318128, partial [Neurospora hispaniola]